MSSKRSIKLVTLGLAGLLFALCGLHDRPARAFSSGPPAGYTGAPGEVDCTACHTSFEVNSGEGSVSISGLPDAYIPGQQVALTVTVDHSDGFLYGFQVTAIDETGKEAGDLVPTDVVNTQERSTTIDGQPRQYIEHTFSGTFPLVFNQRSWTFTWVAPATDVGPVTFYAAGNGADGNQEPTGDYIYTTSAQVSAAEFDLCIQDDSGAGQLSVNTSTGDYSFTNCNGSTASGTGNLTKKGCTLTLMHVTASHRVTVKIDTCVGRSTASVQTLGTGHTVTLTDRNIRNNSCVCDSMER